MPVPPITTHDEPWPFFLFRGHHFWPKLALSKLIFCRGKRSFQWCPDQSDQPYVALHMQKMLKKLSVFQSKISCHYTWLLQAKNCPSRWRFLRSFLTASKPSRRSITAAKRKERRKRKVEKKFPKISKFWFLHMPESNWMFKRDHLFELICNHMDIILSWETWMKTTVFVMQHHVCEQEIEEDEPSLICTLKALSCYQ